MEKSSPRQRGRRFDPRSKSGITPKSRTRVGASSSSIRWIRSKATSSKPPFEYALLEPTGHGTPSELPLRVHVTEATVETVRYTHELTPVASSRDEFVDHVRTEHIAVEYTDSDLTAEREEILAASREGTGYEDEGSRSDALTEILTDLDLSEMELSDGADIATWLRYYVYDGDYYRLKYRISYL